MEHSWSIVDGMIADCRFRLDSDSRKGFSFIDTAPRFLQNEAMSVVEDVRQVIQDFLAPELRTITARLDAIEKIMLAKFESVDTKFGSVDTKLESLHKEIQGISDKLDLDRRLAKLEARQPATQ
ncbi:MAG TPA: hypothetical protein VF865_20585 [Acidobacteriaceae bacterium]